MSLNEDLKNRRIVIRDVESERTIADTVILTYDETKEQIEIESGQEALTMGTTISALIFSTAGLYESHGTVGETGNGKTVITLYEGTARNDRHAVRYQVNIHGTVSSVTRSSGEKLEREFDIIVLNMSSIGLLMEAPAGEIQQGDVIRFSAVSKGQRIVITAEAMRVGKISPERERIGCSVRLVNLG